MLVKCDQCGKEYKQRPSMIKKYLKHYCSRACKHLGQVTRKTYSCALCGVPVIKSTSDVNKSKSGNVFCSKSCACSLHNSKLRTGENNPNWKVDAYAKYVKKAFSVYVPKCSICGFDDINALQVHHIDEDRSNIDIDNLIILCANHHSILHRKKEIITEEIKAQRQYLPISE